MVNPSFSFSGKIITDASGLQQIANFYNYCNRCTNNYITINLNSVTFFDANLSSLLLALATKMKRENNLKFFIDFAIFNNRELGVLKRNGLAKFLCNHPDEVKDERDSVIPVRAFKVDDADGFANYIERDLFRHRGLVGVSYDTIKKLKNSYFEIFDNVGIHAATNFPVIACGQYFPTLEELKFTLVDLGQGFLKKIAAYTINSEKPVMNAAEAISWAIKGGSTKEMAEGGTGLKRILMYCLKNSGSIHIYSDGCYWLYDGSITTFTIKNSFAGATISLIFRNLS